MKPNTDLLIDVPSSPKCQSAIVVTSDKEPFVTTRNVSITITSEQWNDLYRRYKLREKMCEIGMDSPQLDDLVMFQIFKQIIQ